MAHVVREVRERTVDDGVSADSSTPSSRDEYTMTVLERSIYYIGGVISAVIGLRIILSLLGANRANAFASFIYAISYPFVAPFFGLFNYRMQYGISRFEFESFIALIVWALIAAGLARLVTIGSRREA